MHSIIFDVLSLTNK
uniref:Uncharacterized protein n=1 Tax=Arundo donax TaxID=35708 RepID=A0A0A8Z4X2_ARUDO